ncbi:MAG: DinB family protein [Acidobacteria bacterium]|nr:DinB family protein [Acidobacteriota bacterium]
MLGHIIDAERVFGYRAFRIGRGDETPLAGFDENTYVARSAYDGIPLKELAEEFALVRGGNLATLRRLDGRHAALTGTANGAKVSVRALAYIMAGHVRHHVKGLRENYGVA